MPSKVLMDVEEYLQASFESCTKPGFLRVWARRR
jgi:hypothetical protein